MDLSPTIERGHVGRVLAERQEPLREELEAHLRRPTIHRIGGPTQQFGRARSSPLAPRHTKNTPRDAGAVRSIQGPSWRSAGPEPRVAPSVRSAASRCSEFLARERDEPVDGAAVREPPEPLEGERRHAGIGVARQSQQ